MATGQPSRLLGLAKFLLMVVEACKRERPAVLWGLGAVRLSAVHTRARAAKPLTAFGTLTWFHRNSCVSRSHKKGAEQVSAGRRYSTAVP